MTETNPDADDTCIRVVPVDRKFKAYVTKGRWVDIDTSGYGYSDLGAIADLFANIEYETKGTDD